MAYAWRILTLFAVLTVTITVAPAIVVADEVPEPTVGYDTVSEESGDTDLQKTEIGYNETTEQILVRQTTGDGWNKNNQTVVYFDTDQSNTTGITRDFVSDGTAREDYYDNLDSIGADYVAIAGGSAGNATYEQTSVELEKVGNVNVSTGGDQVEIAIDTDNIDGSDRFDFKSAYIETPDDITSSSNFDFHPDPGNNENRSITFDIEQGIVGTSVQFTVENTSRGPGYEQADVNVELINDADDVTDSEILTITETENDSVTFDELSSNNFDGSNSKIELTLETDLTNYKLSDKSKSISLSPGERASNSSSIKFLSPQVEFNITNGTNSDGSSPFEGEIDYNQSGQSFSFNITLENNSDNNNVSIIRNTITFNRTDRIEINKSDPVNIAGSILQTDVSGSTGVNVSNKRFISGGTGGFEFTVRPEETANGTGANGTVAQVNLNTTIDPGVSDPDSVIISHSSEVTTNESATFDTVETSNTTTVNQTFDKVKVTNAELVTEQNMVNATLLISATAESPAPNNGEIQNITLFNESGSKLDNVTCATPFDSDCSGELSTTPKENTIVSKDANTSGPQYNKTNFTIKAFGTGTPSDYSSDKTNVTEKIFAEGDVGSSGNSKKVDGNVSMADIFIVQDNLGADNGGEFPYEDPEEGISDVDNSGSVNGTDLQKVIEEAY